MFCIKADINDFSDCEQKFYSTAVEITRLCYEMAYLSQDLNEPRTANDREISSYYETYTVGSESNRRVEIAQQLAQHRKLYTTLSKDIQQDRKDKLLQMAAYAASGHSS